MSDARLRIGQIDYLNVLPLFHTLKRAFPPSEVVQYVLGHPSQLNAGLADGSLDAAPASAFEYLQHAERYELLPDLSITASHGPVQSVLLLSPVPLAELPAFMAKTGNVVRLSKASASSTALLKVLWEFAWKLPPARWEAMEPGAGPAQDRPFMEIGNHALRCWLERPAGWHVIDLAQAWQDYSGLPCVFAVWIVRRGLTPAQKELLAEVHTALLHCKANCTDSMDEIAARDDLSAWISRRAMDDYFHYLDYDLDPAARAGLTLYAEHCVKLGLLPGVPVLKFAL